MGPSTIRGARDDDRAAIAAMAAEVVRAGDAFVYRSVERVLSYWFDEGAEVFVAEAGEGDVVGTYVVKPNQPDRGAHVANAGYMVAERARGRGIGRRLAEDSLTTARRLGYRAMQFNMVVATNRPAVRLWKDLGFEVLGTLPGVFRSDAGDEVDAYVMFREL